MTLPLFHNVFFGNFFGQALESFSTIASSALLPGDLIILGQSISGVPLGGNPFAAMPLVSGFTAVLTQQALVGGGGGGGPNSDGNPDTLSAVRMSVKVAQASDVGFNFGSQMGFSLAAMRRAAGALQFTVLPFGTSQTVGKLRPVGVAYIATSRILPFLAVNVNGSVVSDSQFVSPAASGFRSYVQLWGGDLAPQAITLPSAGSSVIADVWLLVSGEP